MDDAVDNIIIDNLNYTYDAGNKLIKVKDTSNHPEGFKDGANTTIEYGYDAFGNMTRDDNKSITSITYNHLNLPKQILFSGIPNRKINYLYNALGQKVEKTVKNNTTVTTTNYISGFHYENDALKFFATAEGYVNHTLSQGISFYNYIYNYTDHLGNNRLSYTLNQTLGNVVIYEQNHYYPFGLKHEKYGVTAKQYIGDEDTGYYTGNVGLTGRYRRNEYQYKYNGKEFQDELNLNVYDYGARNYDSAIGRWMNVDPLAEQAPDWTPYRYGFNNPIRYTDPTGMWEHDYRLNNNGSMTLLRYTDSDTDTIFNADMTSSIKVDKSFMSFQLTETLFSSGTYNSNYRKGEYNSFYISNTSKGNSIFNFFADNTSLEYLYKSFENGGKTWGELVTSYESGRVSGDTGRTISMMQANKNIKLTSHTHSHPGNYYPEDYHYPAYPSGFSGYDMQLWTVRNYVDGNGNKIQKPAGDRGVYDTYLNKLGGNRIPKYFNI